MSARGAGLALRPSARPGPPAVEPLELGLFGEADGLADEPGIRLDEVRGARPDVPARPLLVGFGILAIVTLVAGALLSSLFLDTGVRIAGERAAPHPFEIREAREPSASVIIALSGDPIMIRRDADARPRPVDLGLPAALAEGPDAIGTALMVSDTLVSETGGFMGRLPDEGAATLQGFEEEPQGLTADDILAVMNPAAADGEVDVREFTLLPADIPAEPVERVGDDEIAALVRATAVARGWIDEPRRAGRGTEATAAILRVLGSNTSRIEVAAGGDRPVVSEAAFRIVADEPLAALLARNGFDPAEAAGIESAFQSLHGVSAAIAGGRVFVRSLGRVDGPQRPMQVSLYDAGGFLGAVARADDGSLVAAEEPRVETVREAVAAPPPAEGYSLRDGIYSAAVRNAAPEPVVREAIALLGRTTDLSVPARPGDRVALLWTGVPRDAGTGAGRVLHVALTAGGARIPCYAFRPEPGASFACLDDAGSVATVAGMIPPVKGGRLTSRFGMRVHPVLKYERLHKGIDWGAPRGTPVLAVAPGTVSFAGVASGYGNYVKIAHDASTTTAYAHLDGFDPALKTGEKVLQGQRVGFLGNTGLSTGPHLHFELYVGGQPVDPLTHSLAIPADPGSRDPARAAAFADRKTVIDKALSDVIP